MEKSREKPARRTDKFPLNENVFRCSVCGEGYASEEEAAACSAKKAESQKFKLNYSVKALGMYFCKNRPDSMVAFAVAGPVTKVSVVCPDEEYERRYLGSDESRCGIHVMLYEVSCRCSSCGQRESFLFFTPELQEDRATPPKPLLLPKVTGS